MTIRDFITSWTGITDNNVRTWSPGADELYYLDEVIFEGEGDGSTNGPSVGYGLWPSGVTPTQSNVGYRNEWGSDGTSPNDYGSEPFATGYNIDAYLDSRFQFAAEVIDLDGATWNIYIIGRQVK